MEGTDPHGAYPILKKWYQRTSARVLNISRTDMEKVGGDFQTLYQREDPYPPVLTSGNTRATGQGG